MKNPDTSRTLPSWALPHEDNFLIYGLLVERSIDGADGAICNLHIIGGLNGQTVPVVWGKNCTECFLLALSIVNKLFGYPDQLNSPMAPFLTDQFKYLCQFTSLMPDGERVPAPYTVLAQKFMVKHLCNESIGATDTLTIPVADLLKSLSILVHTQYPEKHG